MNIRRINTPIKNWLSTVTQLVAFAITVASISSCEPDLSDDPIPYQPFSAIQINLNLPEYLSLRTDRGFKDINDGGVRGIIIYRETATRYRAFEKNCSYQPNNACATVEVHSSTLYMIDHCCNSTFDFSGFPTGGPAWRNLRQYEVLLSGNELTITDIIVE